MTRWRRRRPDPVVDGDRPAGGRGAARQEAGATEGRQFDERGVGMVEMAMLLLALTILFAMSIPIVDTLFNTTARINNTYANVSQQTIISTNLQRLIRSAVAPAPSPNPSTVAPVPAFLPGSITPTSMTFYTNVGDPNGPEKVTAGCTPASGGGACASPTSTFTVTITPAAAGTCPFAMNSTATCSWPSSGTRTIITVTNVTNGANSQPLFTFAYGTSPGPGQPVVLTTAPATTTGDSIFNACNAGTISQPFVNCLAGEIQDVTFDLQINGNTSQLHGGNQAEEDTGVFVLSSISMVYDPSVG